MAAGYENKGPVCVPLLAKYLAMSNTGQMGGDDVLIWRVIGWPSECLNDVNVTDRDVGRDVTWWYCKLCLEVEISPIRRNAWNISEKIACNMLAS